MAQRKAAPLVGVPTADPYVRWGYVVEVTDGDTVRCEIDCGFYLRVTTEAMRMLGINAPEHGTTKGDAATAWLKRKLPAKKQVIVRTHKDEKEKYGRLLAEIFIPGQPISVNQQAINSGHAVPWDGHGPRPTAPKGVPLDALGRPMTTKGRK